ncbi:unnamed protein product [Prorocentrum cordatum]|uniref:Plant heme peroxidase family profile domain-containing protein n=1 Tax=Prorocentrum cordatum TaxID=2364126 RepID=A0ABN9U742_9DINO|nr:unnamed protein product [Polarella glacialis]
MGAVKVGLIYVNPEGPLNDPNDLNSGQNPDPEKSAVEIREVFGRMGMNDSETASLIAGGHAFGKCHGAGVMTSGFEGPWTTTPSQWTNQFLTGMLDEEWEQVATPSGSAVQWQTKDRTSILAGTMRLTADLALVNDDAYLALAKHWVCDQQKLDIAFAASWKKLVESGGGWLPVEDRRCEPESKGTMATPITQATCATGPDFAGAAFCNLHLVSFSDRNLFDRKVANLKHIVRICDVACFSELHERVICYMSCTGFMGRHCESRTCLQVTVMNLEIQEQLELLEAQGRIEARANGTGWDYEAIFTFRAVLHGREALCKGVRDLRGARAGPVCWRYPTWLQPGRRRASLSVGTAVDVPAERRTARAGYHGERAEGWTQGHLRGQELVPPLPVQPQLRSARHPVWTTRAGDLERLRNSYRWHWQGYSNFIGINAGRAARSSWLQRRANYGVQRRRHLLPTEEFCSRRSLFDGQRGERHRPNAFVVYRMLLAMHNGWTLIYQYGNGGIVRFPRNYTTMNESIALRQEMIQEAYNIRFSRGSNPPPQDQVDQFYAEIPERIRKEFGNLSYENEVIKASWTNERYDSPVNAVVYVPISTKFATAHGDGKVRYWQSMSGTQLYQMKGHKGPVNALAAHPTKEMVASGGQDGTVRVWLFEGEGKEVMLWDQSEGGPVRSLAFLPGGVALIAGSDDGILRRYDMRSGELVCRTVTYAGATTSMSADPEMVGRLVVGTADGRALVYK